MRRVHALFAAIAVIGVITVTGCSDADVEAVREQQQRGDTLTWDEVAALLTPPARDPRMPAGIPRYSLTEAESRGLVRYTVNGMDASTGESLLLTIERTTDEVFDVYVAPGTVFTPASAGAQRMVAWGIVGQVQSVTDEDYIPRTSILLYDSAPRLLLIEAYCLDFDLANPAPADVFRPAPEVAVMAAQVIAEAKKLGQSQNTIQAAIWIDEDHLTRKEIQAKFDPATDQEVADAFTMLKRLKRPPRGRPPTG